ncbi:MAG: fumarylacetoacetase [Acidobacteriota bacterium]
MTRPAVDATHDPSVTSWVESANQPGADFPVQNLPLGIFTPAGSTSPRVGCAIGDQVLDLAALAGAGLLPEILVEAASAPTLNAYMALRAVHRRSLRSRLFELLRADAPSEVQEQVAPFLSSRSDVEPQLPATVGDYTDFYASVYHATNVGSMFRPNNPLLPNYKHIPIGYHGRASSVRVSGTKVRRPSGQTKADSDEAPSFGPSRLLDYELEVGFWLGPGNSLGSNIAIDEAEEHLVGLCLVNDWSARDLQKWEYQPLGPFLAKSFLTSVSPWVVTNEALAPFRVAAFERDAGDPQPLPYLSSKDNHQHGGIDLTVEAYLSTAAMRQQGIEPVRLSRGSLRYLYWTPAQMITHHSSNGCNLQAGDLLASGTVSGPEKDSRGCLLELTWRGAEPIELPSGESRKFLQSGDEVIFKGYCESSGRVRIGFGECRGLVV